MSASSVSLNFNTGVQLPEILFHYGTLRNMSNRKRPADFDLDRAIEEAGFSGARSVELMPWEKPPFKGVFEVHTSVPFAQPLRVPMPRPNIPQWPVSAYQLKAAKRVPLSVPATGSLPPVFDQVLRKARLEPGVKQSLDREAVVRRWLCVLLHDTSASSLGQTLAGSACDGAELVSETFEGKATSTLLKRVRCIGKYVHWASDNGCDAFPFSIEKIRSYLKDAISGNKKSAIRDFASSLNFCRFVLGFQVSDDVTSHPWFKGTMRFANIRLRDAHRSRTLTVKEVKHLEEALIGGRLDRFDRYALGVMLFQLYARARVSDLRNLFKVYLDITGAEGYIEAHTYEHKSRRITSGPSAVLILVAPIQGLASQPWGLALIQAAKDVGFDFEKGFRGPLLPRFASDYTWSGDAVDAAETTRWLNGILKALMGESHNTFVGDKGKLRGPYHPRSWPSLTGG